MKYFAIAVLAGLLCGISEGDLRSRRATGNANIVSGMFNSQLNAQATYYGPYTGGGACSLDPFTPVQTQPGWITVAAGDHLFQRSLVCGACLLITATGNDVGGTTPIGSTPLKAVVVDRCVGCKKAGIDLFLHGTGIAGTKVQAIDCPSVSGPNGKIFYRFEGSNPWYVKIQILNSKLPTLGLEVLVNNKWHCMRRSDDAHFIANGLGKFNFPLRVRLTSITGERLLSSIPYLSNDVNIKSSVQYTSFQAFRGNRNKACHGQGGLVQPYVGGGGQTTSGRVGSVCKKHPYGRYAHSSSCSKFIHCRAGKRHVRSCPSGLKFNKNIKMCDFPYNVKC